MTAVRPARLTDPAHPLGDHAWAIRALAAGERDLASAELWGRSLERSRRRREAADARRPGLGQVTTAKVSAALVTATLLVPATQVAHAKRAKAAQTQTSDRLLKQGSRGEAVAAAQRALGLEPDGVFGSGTGEAVRAFQREKGLAADGVVGPQTAAALGIGAATPVHRLRSTATGTAPSLKLDRRTTRALQRAVGVRADGSVGPRTRAAIKRAERRHGLPVDGRPDSELLRALGVPGRTAPVPGEPDPAAVAPAGEGAAAAVSAAQAAVGTPYGSGGNGPASFDCSGLTVHAFEQAGVSLPRTSFDQYAQGTRVERSAIQPGDLVFFDTNGPGASHVGIATSSTTAISATTKGVMEHSFSSGYWAEHYIGARRVA